MSKLRFISTVLLVLSVLAWGQVPASATLIHHYTFDETTGTTAFDSGTTPANGTLGVNTGTPATPFTFDANSATGKIGGALNFEGAENDVVTLPNGTLALGTSDFTIAMWIKPTAVGIDNQGLWGQDSSATGAAGSTWARIQGDDIRFIVDQGTPATDIVVADVLTDTDWTHLAFVRRGNKLEIWVDGVGTVSTGSLPASYNINGATGTGIGRYLSGNTLTFNGLMDDFRVYNIALSEQDINALVPEPGNIVMAGIALLGIGAVGLRRKK